MVNILASMTFKIPNYPNVFFEAGYNVEFVEKEFDVTQDGKVREVKFDIVLNNAFKNHSLSFECKSGSAEPEQLLKYSKLTPEEMVSVGGVSSAVPASHTNDIVVVCNDCNLEKIQLDTAPYSFTHMSVSNSPTLVIMHEEPFQDDDLVELFSSPIEYPSFIHEVFRVSGQTPIFKYIKIIATELTALSVEGQESFTLTEMAASVCSTIPGLYPARVGNQMRKEVENKVSSALLAGSQSELSDYYMWDKKVGRGMLKKIKPGCKPMTYKAFKQAVDAISERLRVGGAAPSKKKTVVYEDPNQLTWDSKFE